jgi:hypothetical protein
VSWTVFDPGAVAVEAFEVRLSAPLVVPVVV